MDPSPAPCPVRRPHRHRAALAALAGAGLVLAATAPGVHAQPTPQPPAQSAPTALPARPAEIEAGLEFYRYRLLQVGSKLQRYPQEALDQGLKGAATVEVHIGADGTLKAEDLLKSTGHRVLDDYALNLLARAVPLTGIPPALQNSAFKLQVTVAFAPPE